MDKQKAKQELRTLRDSISEVLGENSNKANSSDIKESIEQAQESARAGAKALKKSLIERIKDLPVVTQVSQLGAAGTVAVSTAAVTQVDIAKDRTEVFVAEVAQDVVEERFEVPQFIDNFVDFSSINNWGQDVIAEKIQEAQAFVAEASEPQQTSTPSGESSDTKPETSSSSQDSSSDSPSDDPSNNTEQKSEEKESKVEEKSSSEETKNDSEKDKSDKQEQAPQEKTEDKQASQENNSSSEPSTESRGVKSIPIIETPIEPIENEIAPHSNIRQVSPTL
jgi:hypothetical protein